MNTIKLSKYGVTITDANIGQVNEQVTVHPIDEPLTLDFEGIRGIDSKVANELLASLRSRQGGQVFIKNTEPMVKSVLIFSGSTGVKTVAPRAAVKKRAPRRLALFSRLFSLLCLLALSFGFSQQAWAEHGFFDQNACGITIYKGGGGNDTEYNSNKTGASTVQLGTISDLYLKKWYVAMWGNTEAWCSYSCKMYYKIYRDGFCTDVKSLEKNQDCTYQDKTENIWMHWAGNENLLSGLVGGNYTLEYWFIYRYNNNTDEYLSNDSKNYKMTFTFDPKYTVTIQAGANGNVDKSSVSAGNITAVSLGTATASTGYHFVNWTTTSDNIDITNSSSYNGATIKARAAGTVTANFAANTYTIQYAGNGNTGGSTTNSTHTYGVAKKLTTNGFTRAYTVTYAYDGADGGDRPESATANYTFANWTYNSTNYTDGQSVTNLTDENGATLTMTAQWNSSSVTLPTPTKTGHNFTGWYNGGTKVGEAGDSYTPSAAVTLTAHWAEDVKYTITIKNQWGGQTNTLGSMNVKKDVPTSITQSPLAPYPGFVFDHWATTDGVSVDGDETGATVTASQAGTITAVYKTPTLSLGANQTSYGYEDITFTPNVNGTFSGTAYVCYNVTAPDGATVTWPSRNTMSADKMGEYTIVATLHENESCSSTVFATCTTTVTYQHRYQLTTWGTDNTIFTYNKGATEANIVKSYTDKTQGSTTSAVVTDLKTGTQIISGQQYQYRYIIPGTFTFTLSNIGTNELDLTVTKPAAYVIQVNKGEHIGTLVKPSPTTIYTASGASHDIEVSNIETGYHFVNWTHTGGPGTVSFGNATQASTTVSISGEGSDETVYIQANAAETTVTLTTSVNDAKMGSVSTGGTVGITTGLTMTATKKDGYKFDHWVLSSNLNIQNDKTINDNPITVNTNGDGNPATAQAVFVEDLSTDWQLNFSHNGWHLYDFVKETGQSTGNVAYYSIDLEIDKTYEFNIRKKSTDTYYKNTGTMTATNCTNWTFVTPGTLSNAWITATVAGTYKFKIDFSGDNPKISVIYPDITCIQGEFDGWSRTAHAISEDNNWTTTVNITQVSQLLKFRLVWHGAYYSNTGTMTSDNCTGWTFEPNLNRNHCEITTGVAGNYTFSLNTTDMQLSVTYPGEQKTPVTVYLDGVTASTVEVGEATKPSITAQVPEGMNFNGWVCTGSAEVADASSATTTVTNAGTNGTVKATFNTNNRIYLKGGSNFADAYMNFYKDNYWDKDLGSGNNSDLCVGKNWKMYKVTNTDIFWLDITDAPDKWKDYFSFVNKSGNYGNFHMCNVVYRSDMKDALPFYVPRNGNASEHHNSSQYFNEGIWMKYNDTYSGYDLRGEFGNDDSWKAHNHNFIAATPGGYEFTTTVHLDGGQTIPLMVYNENGTAYGNIDLTKDHPYDKFYVKDVGGKNSTITTTAAGDYVFKLSLGGGEVIVSVEYPLSEGDYRVVSVTDGKTHSNGYIYKKDAEASKASFHITKDHTSVVKMQKCTAITGSTITWTDVEGKSITTSGYATGVYTFNVTPTAGNEVLTKEGIYTGNFYVRTDGLDGGWESYLDNEDNKMYHTLINPEYEKDNAQGYDYYQTKWVNSGKNVKFTVANDYSKCISDTLEGDAILGLESDGVTYKQVLPDNANVRFAWNSNTNTLSRAYISSSTDIAKRFLVLTGDNSGTGGKYIYDTNGDRFNVSGLNQDETNFADNGNWVYQVDIKADVTARGQLTANFNGKTQYFKGNNTGADWAAKSEQIIGGTGGGKYNIRIVYDFKTNTMVAGWLPGEMPITEQEPLSADVIIVRHGQEEAKQISFSGSGAISDVKRVYGALEFRKEEMVDKMSSWTSVTYQNCIYYISFPFDVRVSDIFGIGDYNDTWVLQEYNGQKRAQIGWFAETSTFWEDVPYEGTLKANVGYGLIIDRPTFNDGNSSVWKNTKENSRVYIYFPSAEHISGLVQADNFEVNIPSHRCNIDRDFVINKGTDAERTVNHQYTDSHWNMMGVPVFQTVEGTGYDTYFIAEEDFNNFKYLYAWKSTDNTLFIQDVNDGEFEFKAMHGYMVQYTGDITWSGSIVEKDKPDVALAPRRETPTENFNIELQLHYGGNKVNHTYVELREGANTDFALNEDVYMMTNSNAGNIYSLAGSYDVAANVLPIESQLVSLGVIANKAGDFTFTMPSNFTGTATLIDAATHEETILNVADYTIKLAKGTYEGRFFLKLDVERKIGTDINGADYQGRKDVFKYIDNDHMYIMRDGKLYDGVGASVK